MGRLSANTENLGSQIKHKNGHIANPPIQPIVIFFCSSCQMEDFVLYLHHCSFLKGTVASFGSLIDLSSLIPWARHCGEGLWTRHGVSEDTERGGSVAIERSTYSEKALKRQVLIWDFKCFSLWYIQLASEPCMGVSLAPQGLKRGPPLHFSSGCFK